MAEPISIIVTTYERPDALDAVLRALAQQSDRDFEVVVADDGSGPETAAVVARWVETKAFALTHVWHADAGFRAAEIRNRAVLHSRGAYCIFLDGDCIPRPDFVAQHRALAEPGWFVAGNRILLTPALTEQVLRDGTAVEHWRATDLARARLTGGVNRLAPALHLPLGALRKLNRTAWQGARSCNLAVWRRDLDRVDGFDAAFSGWGLEDSDLVIRLLRTGVCRKDGRFATGVLHLWHPESNRAALPENQRKLDAVIAGTEIKAQRGLTALSHELSLPAPSVPAPSLADQLGVDAVYVLSVKTFTDRIAHVQQELARHDLPFEFIFDYDAAELTPEVVAAAFGDSPMSPAHKSLVLKHREAWRLACARRQQRILVFEDDAILHRRFGTLLRTAMQAADALNPGWLVYLGGSDTKVSRDFILDPRPLVPRSIATAEGYVTDLAACERRVAWCAQNKLSIAADHLIAQMDSALGIQHYWLPQSIVEQGSVTGKFTTVLDKNRLKHGWLYNVARNRWFKFKRRTLRAWWVRMQHAVLRSGGQ